MIKRLLGWAKQGKPQTAAPSVPTRAKPRLWDKPQVAYGSYFALHLRGVTLDEAEQLVAAHYLLHGTSGAVGALLARDGAWVTAYMPEATVRGVGFNRLASLIARERGDWVLGYRIFEWQGMDVHYFNAEEHVDQLAFAQNEIEFEPEEATLFASLADVSGLFPRPATQHPLDFHFALLAAFGLARAALSWEAALAEHEGHMFEESRVLRVP